MKKISITILAILYLAVSSGIAMNIHQCMGKIYSVGLFGHTDKCGKCGMKAGHGLCCNDKFKMVKLSESHLASSVDITIHSPVTILEDLYPFKPLLISYTTLVPDRFDHSPPGSSKSLCVLNCIYRI